MKLNGLLKIDFDSLKSLPTNIISNFNKANKYSKIVSIILLSVFVVTIIGAAIIIPKDSMSVDRREICNNEVSAKVKELPNDVSFEVKSTLKGSDKEITFRVDPKYKDTISVGDSVRLCETSGSNSTSSQYIFYDFNRTTPVIFLCLIFILAVICVARFRGFRNIVGLFLSIGVVVLFTIPSLMAGSNALLIGLITCSLIMYFILYLSHGFSIKTSNAILGTLMGVIITSIIGIISLNAMQVSGYTNEDAGFLVSFAPNVNLKGVLLCGVIIGLLGVLTNISIAQSSTVQEIFEDDEDLTRKQVFLRAMKVGKEHITSTVYTITFVYIGASLASTMWIYLSTQSNVNILLSNTIAEEVVTMLVSGIGLVLSIPLTTLIATCTLSAESAKSIPQPPGYAPPPPPPLPGLDGDDDDDAEVDAPFEVANKSVFLPPPPMPES